jgi:hypothetical protein
MFSRRSAANSHQLAAFPLETQAEFVTSKSLTSHVAAAAVDHTKVS